MKSSKINVLILLIISLLGACKSPDNDPAIQAEIDKLKGIWKIESYNFENVPEQSKKVFSGGKMKFNILTFNPKYTSPTKISISGDIQIGEVFFVISNYYNFEKKNYFKLHLGGKTEYLENNSTFNKEHLIILSLWDGEWEIKITDNKLIAEQVSNTNTPDARLGFTATRQN